MKVKKSEINYSNIVNNNSEKTKIKIMIMIITFLVFFFNIIWN